VVWVHSVTRSPIRIAREWPMNWPQPVQKVLKIYVVVHIRKNKSTGKMGFGLGWSAAAVTKVTSHSGGQNKPDLGQTDMMICFHH
jgi:hypothetical protein